MINQLADGTVPRRASHPRDYTDDLRWDDQPAEADAVRTEHPEFDQLALVEVRAQRLVGRVVDGEVVGGDQIRVPERCPLGVGQIVGPCRSLSEQTRSSLTSSDW